MNEIRMKVNDRNKTRGDAEEEEGEEEEMDKEEVTCGPVREMNVDK